MHLIINAGSDMVLSSSDDCPSLKTTNELERPLSSRTRARLAHEINNPLTCILANLHVVIDAMQQSESETAEDRADLLEALMDAREAAEQLGRLTKELVVRSE